MSSSGIVNFEDATIQAVEMYATEKLRIGVSSSSAKFAVGGDIEISGDINVTGNIIQGSAIFSSNGSSFNGANTLILTNPTTGLTVSSNAVVTGNVTADYFVGDGGLLSNIESVRKFTLSAITGNYVFSGPGFDNPVNDPIIILSRGFTYIFDNTSNYTIHPFKIRLNSGGANYTNGVIDDGFGTTTFNVPMDAPTSLYYQCSVHSSMGNIIKIVDNLDTNETLILSNTTTGLSVSSNAVVTGNVTADYFVGDGSNLTGISGGIDTTQTLALSNVTTGLTVSSNASVDGTLTTDQLKILSSIYHNDDVVLTKTTSSNWVQKGSDIDGEAAGDQSGRSVSLSSDGSIMAIGAASNDGTGSDAGHVRIYEWSGSAWVQKGSDIDGEAADDYSGYSVSLSSDGSIVAIGAYWNDGNGSNAGHVRIYEWSGSAWVQKGSDINGEAANDQSGYSVSLSSDGSIVAIGAPYNDGTGSDAGHVRVYEWSGSAWVQKGSDIDGEAAGDQSGYSVSLSSDGSIMAIGAYWNDGNGSEAGHTRIYEWSGSAWVQKGSDIDGEAGSDMSGSSVSLSSDGSIVAIGAIRNGGTGSIAGHVRVYELPSYKVLTTDQIYTTSSVGIGTSSTSFTLEVNGTAAKTGGGSWDTTSDMRLKDNIEDADLDKCYDLVKTLKLRRFSWKDEVESVRDKNVVGWIAQEVEEVIPKAITTVDHKYGIDDVKFLNPDQIYAAMYGAIQKLIEDKERLEAKIEELLQ